MSSTIAKILICPALRSFYYCYSFYFTQSLSLSLLFVTVFCTFLRTPPLPLYPSHQAVLFQQKEIWNAQPQMHLRQSQQIPTLLKDPSPTAMHGHNSDYHIHVSTGDKDLYNRLQLLGFLKTRSSQSKTIVSSVFFPLITL